MHPRAKMLTAALFVMSFLISSFLIPRVAAASGAAASGVASGGSLYSSLSSRSAEIPRGHLLPPGSVSALSAGEFLVASRQLEDPVFGKSVILIISYDKSGAMGLIVNRPSKLPLSKLFPKIKGVRKRGDLVYIGGPVQMDKLFLLVAAPPATKGQPGKSLKIFDNVYLSRDTETFREMAGNEKAQFHIYAGYAGWEAGQLESEISRGDWYLAAADTGTIFNEPPEGIWPRLIEKAGFEVRQQKPGLLLTARSRGSRRWSFRRGE